MKKGQEEIVGFVMIVLVISIVMLIFLVMVNRSDRSTDLRESREVVQFLESSMEYTSDCAIKFEPDYSRMGELLKECNLGRNCLSGESACQAFNRTYLGIVNASWKIGADRPVKGFMFNSTYFTNSTSRQIVYIRYGNCSRDKIGSEQPIEAFPGRISNRMVLCY